MGKPGTILIAILVLAVSTLWIREARLVCALEGAVFVAAIWLALGAATGRYVVVPGRATVLLAVMAAWGGLQVAANWTVIPAETGRSIRYWLAAACLSLLGQEVCTNRSSRKRFLEAMLAAGSFISLLGIVQMFTSGGKVFWLFDSGFKDQVIGPFVSPNHYAAFVELLLPVALVLRAKEARHTLAYTLVAAALAASVVASGSRAGTILVAGECLAVFCLQPWMRDQGREASHWRWAAFAVLVATFSLVVGYQYLWQRFSEDPDPLLFRREFFASSVAMVRTQPVHGFGLGTWRSVYPQFAIVDADAEVNHSHNEWIQWAADGGIPALACMALLLAVLIPAAVRSVWGIGVISVFVHSAVDYPFLRLGLAAWAFVLMGGLMAYDRERRRLEGWPPRAVTWPGRAGRLLAATSVPVLLIGLVENGRTAWADSLYREGSPAGIARAAELCPGEAEYRFALAQVDPENAISHLRAALADNPYHSRAAIALATQLEQEGDLGGSEAELLEMARRDRQYESMWAMTNFYFRNGGGRPFWRWARGAASIANRDLHSLFDLCFLATPDARVVADRVVPARRIVEREFLSYLVEQNRIEDSYWAARRLAPTAGPEDKEPLLNYVDRALAARQFAGAREVWSFLGERRLIPPESPASGWLSNGNFEEPVLNRGFDWLLPSPAGVVASQLRSPRGELLLTLSGKQPEACEILAHFVRVPARSESVLSFEYRTAGLPNATGLYWTVGSAKSPEWQASDDWVGAEWPFRPQEEMVRLVLEYRRSPGTTRAEGSVRLRHVRLAPREAQVPAKSADKSP